MKSQNGITLISLTVYVIGIVLIVSIMAVLTTNFYSNIENANINIEPYTEYTKFNSYFSEEINKSNIKILDCAENYIVFDNGVQYTFVSENKGIYHNKVKICKDVTSCKFYTGIQNGNDIVKVEIMIGNKSYINTYTLKK